MFDAEAPAPNFETDWNKPPTPPMLVASPASTRWDEARHMRYVGLGARLYQIIEQHPCRTNSNHPAVVLIAHNC